MRAKSARRARKASPRVVLTVAGIAALIVIAIVGAVAGRGGTMGSSAGPLPTHGTLVNALPGAGEADKLFRGIPQKGLTLGSPAAPVTLVEYIDLQCPYCRDFETKVMPSLVARYVRTGKLRVEARPLAFIGPDSVRGRNAMIAAGGQRKAFDLAQVLYANQGSENMGWLSDATVARAAESIPGLDPRRVFADRSSPAVAQQAATSDAEASAAGVTQTPTLYVGKTGTRGSQVQLHSATDEAAVVQAINAAVP